MYPSIPRAIALGKLTEETVRDAVKPLFYVRMRLGLYDPPDMNPYSQLSDSALVQCDDHRQLSLEAAMRSFVLLKNSGQFLPLKRGFQFEKVAVRFNRLPKFSCDV